jgi:hypothetical protein
MAPPLKDFKEKSFTLLDAVDEIANVVAVKFSASAAITAKTDTLIIFRNFIKILLLSSNSGLEVYSAWVGAIYSNHFRWF